MAEDISERKRAEEELKEFARKQGILLREVNHRVKNNLSALISILRKEEEKGNKDSGDGFVPLLHDLIGRVEGLSTVHTMLSATGWQPLKCSELCEQVAGNVLRGVQDSNKSRLFVTPSEATIGSDQAHHLTLVLNELATNSVKHAIDKGFNLEITIDISVNEEYITLHFKDNGPGYPSAMLSGDYKNVSIGFELIRGIVTQSLNGSFEIFNKNGANTIITFELDELVEGD